MKLEIADFDPEMLQTIWGSGYRLTKRGTREQERKLIQRGLVFHRMVVGEKKLNNGCVQSNQC